MEENKDNKCCQTGADKCCSKNKCCCMCHNMVPMLIVVMAVVILLGNLGTFSEGFVKIAWPILLGLIGVMKMMKGKCKCC